MPFLKDCIAAASKKIHDACPDVVLEDFRQGYGPRLVGYKRDAHGAALPETYRVVIAVAGRNGEPSYSSDIDTLIKFWST